MKEKNIIGPFVRNGILIGLLFPLFSILFCAFCIVPDNYFFSFKNIHNDFPLLWVIDSAPIVLGLISFFVGTRVRDLSQHYLKKIKTKNNEITETNSKLNALVQEKEIML